MDTIFSIVSDEELKDVNFCKRLIERAIKEGKRSLIRGFFEKINTIFVFGDPAFRKDLIGAIYPTLRKMSLEELIHLGKGSISANVVILYYFFKNNQVINANKIKMLSSLASLKFINDPYIYEFIPSLDNIEIELNEDVVNYGSTDEIEKVAIICEFLLDIGFIERNETSIQGLHILYKYSSSELKLREKVEIVPERRPTLTEFQKRIDEYRKLIKDTAEEPKFQAFFEKNPMFLNWQVTKFLAEKSFGGEQFPDLILFLKNRSYVIVELEKPGVKLYTKRGDPSQELSHAEEQVRGYIRWAIEDKQFLRKRGLENLTADNTTGLLIIGSYLTQEERKKLDTHNNSVRSMYTIKTFSDVLEDNEAFLKNLLQIPT